MPAEDTFDAVITEVISKNRQRIENLEEKLSESEDDSITLTRAQVRSLHSLLTIDASLIEKFFNENQLMRTQAAELLAKLPKA